MPARLAQFGAALAAVALAVTGCSSSTGGGGAGSTSTSATTAAATTTTPPSSSTSTTVYTPASPQSTPDNAAAALISDWASGSRAAAAKVAAPAAVAAVFSQPYPYSYMQPRGCTAPGTTPGTCTYANRQSGALYEIGVTRYGSGWYVSSVTVES